MPHGIKAIILNYQRAGLPKIFCLPKINSLIKEKRKVQSHKTLPCYKEVSNTGFYIQKIVAAFWGSHSSRSIYNPYS